MEGDLILTYTVSASFIHLIANTTHQKRMTSVRPQSIDALLILSAGVVFITFVYIC